MTMKQLAAMSGSDLNREIAHARNKRDAFSAGREPQAVMRHLRRLLDEQIRRRQTRRAA